MRKSGFWRHSNVQFPFDTFIYEIDEVFVVAVKQRCQVLVTREAHFALAVRYQNRLVVIIEENLAACGTSEY